jgi:PAT family acetyl-CoA transporter-like MFS transporter 1
MIRRETLGLITMPLILIKVTVPLFLSRTRRPLLFYAHSYVPRLIVCVLIAVFVFFGSTLQLYPTIFYILLVVLLGLDDALIYLQGAARGGFFAYISDTRIGSTYYTFLASLNNLGMFVSSSAVLHTANWLPKEHAYFIETGICILLGCVWLVFSWRLMHRLQETPVNHWHLVPHPRKLDKDKHHNHQIPMTDNKKVGLTTGTINTELSSWI